MKTILQALSRIPHFDKLLHFTACFVSSFVEMSFVGSWTHTAFGAVTWELSDWKHGNFSWGDMAANCLGIISGVILHYVVF